MVTKRATATRGTFAIPRLVIQASARLNWGLPRGACPSSRRRLLGKQDPAFRTKPQIGLELVGKTLGIGVAFRTVVADCFYGDHCTFERTPSGTGLPFVLGIKSS